METTYYAPLDNNTNHHDDDGPIRGGQGEDWLHDLHEIHKEFAKAAWDVTGFQEEYRMWCRRVDDDDEPTSNSRHRTSMSTYEELFAMNEKYLRIIETNLVRVKFQLEADKANNLLFGGDSDDQVLLVPTYNPATAHRILLLGPRSSSSSSNSNSKDSSIPQGHDDDVLNGNNNNDWNDDKSAQSSWQTQSHHSSSTLTPPSIHKLTLAADDGEEEEEGKQSVKQWIEMNNSAQHGISLLPEEREAPSCSIYNKHAAFVNSKGVRRLVL